MMNIWLLCILSSTIKDLAAHTEKFDGTLVFCGTPVEKHCARWIEYRLKIETTRSQHHVVKPITILTY
jgi:hypothetical protein